MTRIELDALPSNGKVACPDCGETSTHPTPGCACPLDVRIMSSRCAIGVTQHINKNHHTCAPVKA